MEIANRREQVNISDSQTARTRALLACGILIAPLFYAVALVEVPVRPGFDIRRMAVSSLTLGDLACVQITTVEITGRLLIASVLGIRRALRARLGGRWAPSRLGA